MIIISEWRFFVREGAKKHSGQRPKVTYMFEFAKKLLFARQLNIEKGSLTILNHRFMMIPARTFVNLIRDDAASYKYIYRAAKESGKGYADVLIKAFKADTTPKLEDLLVNTFNLAGWGALEIIKNDLTNKLALLHIRNSAVALEYGKSNKPVCHTNRGFIAGGYSKITRSDVECIETLCVATGNAFCEFVATNKDYLSKKYPSVVKIQI